MKKLILSCLTTVFLFGCNSEEIKTVDWYKQHETERNEMIKKCKNEHSLDGTKNCTNALSAHSSISIGKKLHGDGDLFK